MARPPDGVRTAAGKLEEAATALAEMKLPKKSPWRRRASELLLVKEQIVDVWQELELLVLELAPEPEPEPESAQSKPAQ
jgi:hypothetical protein